MIHKVYPKAANEKEWVTLYLISPNFTQTTCMLIFLLKKSFGQYLYILEIYFLILIVFIFLFHIFLDSMNKNRCLRWDIYSNLQKACTVFVLWLFLYSNTSTYNLSFSSKGTEWTSKIFLITKLTGPLFTLKCRFARFLFFLKTQETHVLYNIVDVFVKPGFLIRTGN